MSAVTARTPSPTGAALPLPRRWFGLDLVELGALIALSGLSLVALAALATRGRPLSGADGLLAADQLQYFAWIREAAHHGLIGNRFDLAPGSRAFAHPGFAISGGLHALGLSVPLAYLLWKPVAVLVTFFGALRYVRRLIGAQHPGRRHTALLLALFAIMPASWVVAWTGWGGKPRQYTFDFISGEMWSGQYLWGYLMTAIAVFLMPLVLLAYERHRIGWAAFGALLVSWLQPWQGATLALIVVAVEGWRWARGAERPPLRPALLLLLGVAVPAAYYFGLSRLDPAWELAGRSNAAGAMPEWSWPWWAITLTVAPLAVPAALAYRKPTNRSWQDQAVRVWPFAALAVYLLPLGTFPYHAFQGLALPLSILAVQGAATVWRRPSPLAVAAILAVMSLPGLAHKLEVSLNSVRSAGDPFWIFPDEIRALDAIEADPRPGGVLGPVYAGYMLPYRTGRETWIGALSWTPDWKGRQKLADGLVDGSIRGASARELVRRTHARWVFVDCRPGLADLEPELGPILERTLRFGCASVYVVRDRPDMARAAGRPDQ